MEATVAIGDLGGTSATEPLVLSLAPVRRTIRIADGFEILLTQPRWQLGVKRLFDIVVATTLLVLTMPLLAVIALLVRLSSPGPVIFAHQRVGRDGRLFRCLKFRSMCRDAENLLALDPGLAETHRASGFKLARREDPRIKSIGAVLRKTSLDELPQLFNVLRGDMSIVGPRPVVEPEMSCYGPLAPAYLAMRPGITGLWQTSGRCKVNFPERATVDFTYVVRWSLLRDLAILARTIPVVLLMRGAY